MTPNVQIAVMLHPDKAADYKWFDIGNMKENKDFGHDEVAALLSQPVPFDNFGIAGVDLDGVPYAVLVNKGATGSEYEGALLLNSAIFRRNSTRPKQYVPGFWLRPQMFGTDAGLQISFVNPKDAQSQFVVEASKVGALILALFLEEIHQPNVQYKMYTATPKTNNAKRIRQGKKPLFDWHTVLIEPPRQKLPDQGGTHASPRLHDVRGHWVNRNGKRYWRKAHQRGDASLGVVFHDYKLKEETNKLDKSTGSI